MNLIELQDFKEEFATIEKCRLGGSFINENSLNGKMVNAYSFISTHYEDVRDFYLILGDTLESDDGFFYFYPSEYEIEQISPAFVTDILDYVDILKFFIEIDSNFSSKNDYVFNISSLETKLNVDLELKNIADNMSCIKKRATNREFLEALLTKMRNDGYIEVFNNKEGRYKLLKSFKFIEDTIMGLAEND